MKKRYTIGVMIGNANSPHTMDLMQGIFHAAQSMDVNVILFLGIHSSYYYKSYFGEDLTNDNKKKKNGYRLDIVLIVSFFVMLISFCAYMMNTTLEEVLENETGSSVVTHDYTYESVESSSAA